jgi:hypothetical protein
VIDEVANVLNPPAGNARADLDGAWVAAGCDARPLGRARNRDERRDWRLSSAVTNDLWKPQEAGFRKLGHFGSPSSGLERCDPARLRTERIER